MDFPRLTPKEYVILELLISHGEMYGLEIVKNSGGKVSRNTAYVTLSRMEDKNYVESRQEKLEDQRGLPRRMYRATGYGARVYHAWEMAQAMMAGSLA